MWCIFSKFPTNVELLYFITQSGPLSLFMHDMVVMSAGSVAFLPTLCSRLISKLEPLRTKIAHTYCFKIATIAILKTKIRYL